MISLRKERCNIPIFRRTFFSCLALLSVSAVICCEGFQPHINKPSNRINTFNILCSKPVEVDGVGDITNSQVVLNRLLTPEQEDYFRLLDVNTFGKAFIERLKDLQEYKNKYGTCQVPKRYSDNPKLGNWVNKSRQLYRKHLEGEKNSMTNERIQILNKMGFLWSAGPTASTIKNIDGSSTMVTIPVPHQQNKDQIWIEKFEQIKDYIKVKGSTVSLSGSTKLGVWAAKQRREYQNLKAGQKAAITQERIDMLDSIGFDWSPWDTKWDLRIQELLEYKQKYGDCMVPVRYTKNEKLGRWVSTQRKYYKLFQDGKPTRISKERIKQLTEIGFVWNRWEHLWNDCEDPECDPTSLR